MANIEKTAAKLYTFNKCQLRLHSKVTLHSRSTAGTWGRNYKHPECSLLNVLDKSDLTTYLFATLEVFT